MRFFFNVRSVHGVAEDYEGEDFPSLAAAQANATRYISDLMIEQIMKRQPIDIQAVEICDDDGKLIRSVTVIDVLTSASLPVERQATSLQLVQPAA